MEFSTPTDSVGDDDVVLRRRGLERKKWQEALERAEP